jgi:hypothetical protein
VILLSGNLRALRRASAPSASAATSSSPKPFDAHELRRADRRAARARSRRRRRLPREEAAAPFETACPSTTRSTRVRRARRARQRDESFRPDHDFSYSTVARECATAVEREPPLWLSPEGEPSGPTLRLVGRAARRGATAASEPPGARASPSPRGRRDFRRGGRRSSSTCPSSRSAPRGGGLRPGALRRAGADRRADRRHRGARRPEALRPRRAGDRLGSRPRRRREGRKRRIES